MHYLCSLLVISDYEMDDCQHVTGDHSIFCIYGTRFRISRPFRSPQLKRHHAVFISRRGTDADAQDDNSASHRLQYDIRSVTSSWVGWNIDNIELTIEIQYIGQSKQQPSLMRNLCQSDSLNWYN